MNTNTNEKALAAFKGAKTTTFRSQGRKVNQDDDMVRVQFDMPITEFRGLVRSLESQPVAGQVSGEAVEAESQRWAERLSFVHREYGVDGSGVDSGDGLDVIEHEIRCALAISRQPQPVSAGKDVIQIGFFERTGYDEDDFDLRHFHEGMNDVPERWVAAYADKKYWDDFLKEKPYSTAQQPQAPEVEVPSLPTKDQYMEAYDDDCSDEEFGELAWSDNDDATSVDHAHAAGFHRGWKTCHALLTSRQGGR